MLQISKSIFGMQATFHCEKNFTKLLGLKATKTGLQFRFFKYSDVILLPSLFALVTVRNKVKYFKVALYERGVDRFLYDDVFCNDYSFFRLKNLETKIGEMRCICLNSQKTSSF